MYVTIRLGRCLPLGKISLLRQKVLLALPTTFAVASVAGGGDGILPYAESYNLENHSQ